MNSKYKGCSVFWVLTERMRGVGTESINMLSALFPASSEDSSCQLKGCACAWDQHRDVQSKLPPPLPLPVLSHPTWPALRLLPLHSVGQIGVLLVAVQALSSPPILRWLCPCWSLCWLQQQTQDEVRGLASRGKQHPTGAGLCTVSSLDSALSNFGCHTCERVAKNTNIFKCEIISDGISNWYFKI